MPRYVQGQLRNVMWFGTPNSMRWIPAPLRGADMSPEGWRTSGTYLNGGGFNRNSKASHKTYTFEWPGSSSRQMAQVMKDYRDGVYSTAKNPLLYFIDPNIYDQNILPAAWAAPGTFVAHKNEYTPLGVASPVERTGNLDLPFTGAEIVSGGGKVTFAAKPNSTVYLSVIFSGNYHTGPVFLNGVTANGVPIKGDVVSLGDGLSYTSTSIITDHTGLVALKVEGSGYTLWGLNASLDPLSSDNDLSGVWSGGMGHSGVEFATDPTYVANTGVNGGQVGYAASFIETGSWLQ